MVNPRLAVARAVLAAAAAVVIACTAASRVRTTPCRGVGARCVAHIDCCTERCVADSASGEGVCRADVGESGALIPESSRRAEVYDWIRTARGGLAVPCVPTTTRP